MANSIRPAPKAAKINSAAKPHLMGREGKAVRAAGVGNEKKADMAGTTGTSNDMGAKGLSAAVGELKRQHPIKHDDLGPHHTPMKKKMW